jgi:hypothetical protein
MVTPAFVAGIYVFLAAFSKPQMAGWNLAIAAARSA